MIGQVVGGLTSIASGIIGSKKRRREASRAAAELKKRKAEYERQDTSNVYTNMQNTMEDLTVNQQAAQFQAEQEQQGLSNIMGQMQGAAGGSGIAALAQSLAGQQSQNLRRASADIGRQEQANQMAERTQASNLQLYEKKGELISRDAEKDKISTLMGMAQQRSAAANQAKQDATNAIIGGIGSTVGGVASALGGTPNMGGSGGGFMQNMMGNG
jgi:hypothetical protein